MLLILSKCIRKFADEQIVRCFTVDLFSFFLLMSTHPFYVKLCDFLKYEGFADIALALNSAALNKRPVINDAPRVLSSLLDSLREGEFISEVLFDENTIKNHSEFYTPRPPRQPGYPDPPADHWGAWDEYRDDCDPGFRIKDVAMPRGGRSPFSQLATTPAKPALFGKTFSGLNSGDCLPNKKDFDLPAFGVVDPILADSIDSVPSFMPPSLPSHSIHMDDELVSARSIATPPAIPSPPVRTIHSPGFGRTTLRYDGYGGSIEVLENSVFIDTPEAKRPRTGETAIKPGPIVICETVSLPHLMLLKVFSTSGRIGFESSKEFDSTEGVIVAGRYRIGAALGSAAFSKAVQAFDLEMGGRPVALKIIKNDKDFLDQSLDEIRTLMHLGDQVADLSKFRVLKLYDFFYSKEHLILVTELLKENLYEYQKLTLRANPEKPYFTLGRVQSVASQVVTALSFVHGRGIIHCDLKPENILFEAYEECRVKVIDFGSAAFQGDKISSYIQSRCYRAPEVVLGLPYTEKIDIWSLGCVLAEIWTGYVLFQNESVQGMLARMVGIIGEFPSWMIKEGRTVSSFFTDSGDIFKPFHGHSSNGNSTTDQSERSPSLSPCTPITILVPKKTSLFQRLRTSDSDFLNFICQCLQIDGRLRPSAEELLSHPFLMKGKYPDGL